MSPTETARSPRRKRRLLKILAALFAVEAAARIFALVAIPPYDYLLDYDTTLARIVRSLKARRGHETQRDAGLKMAVNSEGFRGQEFKLATGGTKTVVCIGNGATHGDAVPDDKTWPALLEAELNKSGGETFAVYNMGTPGAGAYFAREFLIGRALALKPTAVVLAFAGLNDSLGSVATEKDYFSRRGPFWSVARSFKSFELMERALYKAGNRRKMKSAYMAKVPLDDYEKLMSEMIDMTKSAGAQPALLNEQVLFPDLPDFFSYETFEKYRQAMKGLAREKDIPETDPKAFLSDKKEDGHFQENLILYTAEGNRLIAERLAAALLERLHRDS